jgi:hypothetical protein
MAKTRLTFTVEGAALYNAVNPTEIEILSFCAISDENGTKALRGDIKTKLFDAFVNNDVRWEGISVDDIDTHTIGSSDSFPIENDYSISIDFIIYYPDSGDKNFFERVIIEGKGNRKKKHVTVKVKSSGLSVNDEYTYLIIFTIYPPKGLVLDSNRIDEPKSFGIDPKLQIK